LRTKHLEVDHSVQYIREHFRTNRKNLQLKLFQDENNNNIISIKTNDCIYDNV
jgi:hypothetical protein